jgi:hypothetical protein
MFLTAFTITKGEPPRSALISIVSGQSGPVPALAWDAAKPTAIKTPVMQLNVRCNFITDLLFETLSRISESKSTICPPAPVAAETQLSQKTTNPPSMSTAFFTLPPPLTQHQEQFRCQSAENPSDIATI